MNKERLKKLIYDLEITNNDIEISLKLLKNNIDNSDLKSEFSNRKYNWFSRRKWGSSRKYS